MLNTNFAGARARIRHVIRHFYAVKTLDIYVLFHYYIAIQADENTAEKKKSISFICSVAGSKSVY